MRKSSMRKSTTVAAGLLAGLLIVAGAAPAFATGNPSGTGRPDQSCQDIEAAGGTTPGHASSSRDPHSTSRASTAPTAGPAASTTAKPHSTTWPASTSPSTDPAAHPAIIEFRRAWTIQASDGAGRPRSRRSRRRSRSTRPDPCAVWLGNLPDSAGCGPFPCPTTTSRAHRTGRPRRMAAAKVLICAVWFESWPGSAGPRHARQVTSCGPGPRPAATPTRPCGSPTRCA